MSDDHFDDSPMDLSPLDPDLVSAVMRRVATMPAHDPSRIGPLWALWSMSRGLTATAALAIFVVLALLRPWQDVIPRPPATVAESIGVPPEFQEPLVRRRER